MKGVEGDQTVRVRIVLFLSDYSRWKGKLACPRQMTQEGIAEGLGLTRNHVSVEVGRACEAGLIEAKDAHVNGCKRILKAYSLTELGERLLIQLRELYRELARLASVDDGHAKDEKEGGAREPEPAAAEQVANRGNPATG